MNKFINWLYSLAPRQFNALVYETTMNHKDWREHCEVAFIDTDGTKYWRYKPDYKMPIQRMSYVDTLKLQYVQAWGAQEQQLFDQRLDDLFQELEKDKGLGSYYKKLANLKSLLDEKRMRESHIIQTDILIEMVACLLIRDDENPTEVNEKVLAQKVETFKKKVNFSFLKQMHILEWMGLSHLTEKEFSQLWDLSQKHLSQKINRLNSITKE